MKWILTILLVLWAAPGLATDYTVCASGCSYTSFTALVAAENLTAGDTVDGHGETFDEEWIPDGSGTAAAPIKIMNATIERFDGNDKDYLWIEGLKAVNTGLSIPFEIDGDGNIVKNCIVNSTSAAAQLYIQGTNNLFHDISIYGGSGSNACIVISGNLNGAIYNVACDNETYGINVVTGVTVLPTFDYNIYNVVTGWNITDEDEYTTLAEWQAATGGEANSIAADPLFLSPANGDFRLQASSPAINAGTR